jgi:hypothetical protein
MTDVPAPANLNGLTAETLKEALLMQNYLPRQHDHREELPPIFHSRLFTPAVADALRQIPVRKPGELKLSGYDLMPFKRTRHPNIPRVMGIPHPRAYAELVHAICEGWDNISQRCASPNSQIQFELHEDGRMLVHAYDQIADDGEVENQDPLADFGKRFLLKTDINSFYPSVYSHALPWALVGHPTAKKDRDKTKWFNAVDHGIQLCQRGETRGLPIGPGSSSIVAEALLFPVDAFLREKGYYFTRYIDDYTVFLSDAEECDRFLRDLAQTLESYALSLNIRKTKVVALPTPSREPWATEINTLLGERVEAVTEGAEAPSIQKIRAVIDKAITLSAHYPDGSVMKYALSALIERFSPPKGLQIVDDPAVRLLEDSIFRHAYHTPAIIPLIQRWLQHFPSTDQRVEARVVQRLRLLLDRAFELGQSDNIIWCLYYLLQVGEPDDPIDLEKCLSLEDPMVVTMGYCFAKYKGLQANIFREWATKFQNGINEGSILSYDIDRNWLPLYLMYFDNVINEMPYGEACDRQPFVTLKEREVTFFDDNHADFNARVQRYARAVFGDVRTGDPASDQETIEAP